MADDCSSATLADIISDSAWTCLMLSTAVFVVVDGGVVVVVVDVVLYYALL